MPDRDGVRRPPEAPEIERRILLTRLQIVGLPILALFPLLALVGAFGLDLAERTSRGSGLEVAVEYPSRARLRSGGSLVVEVRNDSDGHVDGVTVLVERNYLDGFSEVAFAPSATALTETHYRIDLGRLDVGETLAVTADLRPREYWRHRGTVSVSAEGIDTIEIELSSFVFP